jgi:XRE family transcriptional regulator, fatty acid utilization regulator
MPETSDPGAGARIAVHRKLHHLTQRDLAARAHVSYSLINKVERGAVPTTPALVAACARALGLDITDLQPTPHVDPVTTRAAALMPLMAPIRAALDLYDLPPSGIQPRPLPQLAEAVRAVNRLAQSAKYRPMAEQLPGLLEELHTAAHTATGNEQCALFGLLAEAYRCGHSVGIAIGLNDLSAIALARMDWAAQQAGDRGPALRAVREYLRVTRYLRADDLDACRRVQAAGCSRLDGTDSATPGALVAAGQLHLGSAVVAARAGDLDTMRGHLDEAGRIAEQTGERDDLAVHFGPTNVAVHRVMTLVEAGQHDQALTARWRLQFPAGWAPTRIGHHHIDMARALRWTGRHDAALAALQRARKVAPQQAKHHPLVHETVTGLVHATRRPSEALTSFAAWCDVRP